ncbi:MAG TPA: hypothetical protein VHB72_02290 [Candidatus Saccharimonadales bacterium]|nr:hypothetical protein [Candidatus Saccharimonadales bacterium]
MELFVDICSFLGSWLLVAGPIYQASLELREQDIETERIHEASNKIQTPRNVSAWWWLIPPLKLLLEHQQTQKYRREYLNVLDPEDVEALVNFINKATGWLMVAGGASLIAVKETYELVDEIHVQHYFIWLAVPVMMFFCLIYTILRTKRAKRIIAHHGVKEA